MKRVGLLILFAVMGCGKSQLGAAYEKIHLGMTMDEVRAVAGNPSSEESSATSPYVWIYVDKDDPASRLGIGFDVEKRVILSDFNP